MRLWTLHPRYLDARGLVALWREALLAQKVLQGGTKGYKHHPQLARFQFLLEALLNERSARVVCLVRAASRDAARQRVLEHAASLGIDLDACRERIGFVAGDLALPRLGLSPDDFARLGEVDEIVHCGAWVNFLQEYRALRASNVDATRTLLDLAVADGRTRRVHYVSTLSLFFFDYADTETIPEGMAPTRHAALRLGYVKSKWVADRICNLARQRGIPVSIYRPADIGPQSKTGAYNADDFVSRLVIGSAQLGFAPDAPESVEIWPVDAVAREIALLSAADAAAGKDFHITGPEAVKWSAVIDGIRACGIPIAVEPAAAWRSQLADRLADRRENPLFAMQTLWSDNEAGDSAGFTETYLGGRIPKFQRHQALAILGRELLDGVRLGGDELRSFLARARLLGRGAKS